jgi:hypothetical protein
MKLPEVTKLLAEIEIHQAMELFLSNQRASVSICTAHIPAQSGQ